MSYFKGLEDKSIVKLLMGSFGPLFLVQFPYRNRVKIVVFEPFLSKSIVNAENGVFLTLVFSMIPL